MSYLWKSIPISLLAFFGIYMLMEARGDHNNVIYFCVAGALLYSSAMLTLFFAGGNKLG